MQFGKFDLINMCEFISPLDFGTFNNDSVDELETFILSFYSSIDDCYTEYIKATGV